MRDGMAHGTTIITLLILLGMIFVAPAASQGPGDIALYQEDFDGGQARSWDLESGWTVVNGVLTGEGHHWARYTRGLWSDYRLRLHLRIITGDVHINYRLSDAGRYYVGFYGGNSGLSKQYFPGQVLQRHRQ